MGEGIALLLQAGSWAPMLFYAAARPYCSHCNDRIASSLFSIFTSSLAMEREKTNAFLPPYHNHTRGMFPTGADL